MHFKFHKWCSNVPGLEGEELENETDQTFTKQQLDIKYNEIKEHGLSWKNDKYLLAVKKSSEIKKVSKRTVLQKLESMYYPLGKFFPTTIIGRII